MPSSANLDESPSPYRKRKKLEWKLDKNKVCKKYLNLLEVNNCLDGKYYRNPDRSYRVGQNYDRKNTYRTKEPEEREK